MIMIFAIWHDYVVVRVYADIIIRIERFPYETI